MTKIRYTLKLETPIFVSDLQIHTCADTHAYPIKYKRKWQRQKQRLLLNSYHTLTVKKKNQGFRAAPESHGAVQQTNSSASLTQMCHPVKVSCIMQELQEVKLTALTDRQELCDWS